MKQRSSGFTLIEMMFTVLILGTLLVLGVPGLRDFFRNSRMTAAANDLLADINIARTESIKRRAPVTVCASAGPLAATPACAAKTATSFTGWFVFVDHNGDHLVSGAIAGPPAFPADVIIRRHELLPTGTTAKSDAGFISFADSGFLRSIGADASATRVVICDDRGNADVGSGRSAGRAVTVSPTGRAGVTRTVTAISGLGGC